MPSILRLVALVLALVCGAVPTTTPVRPTAGPPASVWAVPQTSPAAAPNVVVVVIDDMGWEDLFHAPTPNMLALAQLGRLYPNFYVHPVCSPSRIGLNFGIHGVRDGVVGALDVSTGGLTGASIDRPSLAKVLKANGYATACFGKWHVNASEDGNGLEFARINGFEHWRSGSAGNLGKEGSASQIHWRPIDDGTKTLVQSYSGDRITTAFEDWWALPEARPRFALVSYLTPHEPWTAPPQQFLPANYVAGANKRARYEASIAALDGFLARVMASIDLADTYVMVLPDNGTPHLIPPPSHWYKGYKLSVWQGGVNVPFVVAGPGVVPGISERLAHVVDVPETILELCGATTPPGFEDGESFATSLFGPMAPRAPVMVQYKKYDDVTGALVVDDWAVVDANSFKLVSEGGVKELYHLLTDPLETTPLSAPGIVQTLTAVKEAIDP
ncbi:Arylsulfatase precursor [Planctomycetes bacterium Pla163]|uniref:Arylsulfatase n=1 Tax=Rohdeia mirabilis TaxID=2528008 RepID=A0A518D3E0_9BACT|nr:Arylsulfatase precursor [Planctomycetes bacterium Pla163]